MDALYEIKTKEDIVKFANKFGFSINTMENAGTYSISNSNMREYVVLNLSEPIMITIMGKGSEGYDERYIVRDWEDVSFCLSQTLNITIKHDGLFLSKV